MATEPKIYSKNYVNEDDVFVVSHNSAFITKAYDFDKDSQWVTSGANSDATEISIQVDFYEGDVAVSRTIDTLILVNHNLKGITFEYWNGSAWVSLVTPTAAAATTIHSFTSTTCSAVRLRCSTTQIADAEKEIGELVVCLLKVDLADLDNYRPSGRETAIEHKLADGSIHRSVVMFSPNRCEKYEARVSFQYLTQAQVITLQTLKNSGQSFLWQPESINRPDEIYLVNWVGGFAPAYESKYKTAGYSLDVSLKEV